MSVPPMRTADANPAACLLAQTDLVAKATEYGPWGLVGAGAIWVGYVLVTQVVVPWSAQRRDQAKLRFEAAQARARTEFETEMRHREVRHEAEMKHSEATFTITRSMGESITQLTKVVEKMADGTGEIRVIVEGIRENMVHMVTATRANYEAVKLLVPHHPDAAEHLGVGKQALNLLGDDSAVYPPLSAEAEATYRASMARRDPAGPPDAGPRSGRVRRGVRPQQPPIPGDP